MNFLPPYVQENMEEKSGKESFFSMISMEKIDNDEFLEDAVFYNKIVICKNGIFEGNGFSGVVQELDIFIRENENVFKTPSLKKNEEEQIQEIPEFEYLVFMEFNVYMLFKNSNEEVEVFRLYDTVEVYAMIISKSIRSHSMIYACCLYDKKDDIVIKDVTINEEAAMASWILFDNWTE